jgi:cysteine synthase A
MWSWFRFGHLDRADGDSVAEGIGQGRVTQNVADAKVDAAYRIPDRLMVEVLHFLLRHEGLFLGASSGINVCGALKLALAGKAGRTIVTILADGGQRYQSRLFNARWLARKQLRPKGLGLKALLKAVQKVD